MLYFAYGSNLAKAQMAGRCPSAQPLENAVLRGHGLAFTGDSTKWGGGVATVVPEASQSVWGAIYRLAPTDVATLDGCEGYYGRDNKNNVYDRHECQVFPSTSDDEPFTVNIYVVEDSTLAPTRPSAKYMTVILDGALDWQLPETYIATLKEITLQP